MGRPRLIRLNNHVEVVRDVPMAKALHMERFRATCLSGLAVDVRELSADQAQIRWQLIEGLNVRQLLLCDPAHGAQALIDTLKTVRAGWERSWVSEPSASWDPSERQAHYRTFFSATALSPALEQTLNRVDHELQRCSVPGRCLVHGDLYHRNVLLHAHGITVLDAKPRPTSDWVYDLAKLVRLRTYAFRANGEYHPVVDHVERHGLAIGRAFASVAGDDRWEQRFWTYTAVLQLQDLSFLDRDTQFHHALDRLAVEREAITNTRRALVRALGTTERAV